MLMDDYQELYDADGISFVERAARSKGTKAMDTSPKDEWHQYLNAFENQARQFCFNEGQRYDPPIRIRFGLVELDEFRALATKHDSYGYVVLISLGALKAINHLCGLLVSNGFFPDLGKAPKPKKYEPNIEASRTLLRDLHRSVHFTLTADIARQTLGIIFEQTMFRHILFHEIGHAVDGHLELIADRLHLDVLVDQLQNREIQAEGDLTRQALEVLADSIALRHTLIASFRDRENPPSISPEISEALEFFHKTPRETLFHSLVAVYMLFELMDNPERNMRPLLSGYHPPAPFRFKCSLAVVHDWVEENNTIPLDDLDTLIRSVVDTGHALIGLSYQRYPNMAWLNCANGPDADAHFQAIYDECNRLVPILSGYIANR